MNDAFAISYEVHISFKIALTALISMDLVGTHSSLSLDSLFMTNLARHLYSTYEYYHES